MLETIAKVQINKPIDIVYAYTTNPENAKYWYDNVKESDWVAGHSMCVGAKAKLLTQMMGKEIPFVYEIKNIVPNESLLMSAAQGAFPMESEYTFSAIDENTTSVTVATRASPKGVPTFMLNMVRGKVQKTSEEDVQRLKQLIEAL